MTNSTIKPTESENRIPSLDFLRGIAVLGILFINIESFAFPNPWSPWKNGFKSDMDHSTRFWVYFLTQGKFYTQFALLFGVGFMVFLNRLEKKNMGVSAMDIYTRRLLWLFVIGAVHAYFLWDGDVLYHYAICGLLLLPFRSIRNRYLILIISFLAVFPLGNSREMALKRKAEEQNYLKALHTPESKRTEEEIKNIETWKKAITKKSPDTTYAEPHKKTFWQGIQDSYGHISVHKGEFYYPSLVFSSLIVMMVGMILFRLGVFSNYTSVKYYWSISILIFITGLVINYFKYYHWTYEYYKPITNVWAACLFTFHKEILGVGYVLMINGIYQKYLTGSTMKIISEIGRTALSNYIFQSIILGGLFYGYGLALFNHFSRFELLGIIAGIWVVQMAFTWLWLKKYKQGPLEWLWRKLTYYQ